VATSGPFKGSAKSIDALDQELAEAVGVDVDADVAVRLPARSAPEVDERPPARELRLGVDLDTTLLRLDEIGAEDLRDKSRTIVPARPSSRSAWRGVNRALCVTSRPTIVSSIPLAKTRAAASGSAQMLNSAAGVTLPSAIAPPISTIRSGRFSG
jgi:hypothetical protein